MTSVSDIPTGAIENGRVFLQRLADHYDFNCEAGSLANCTDYHEAVRCFEFIAQWISDLSATEPSAARELALEEAAKIADNGNAGWLKKRDVTANKKEARDYETMAIACSHVAAAIRALSSPDHADAGKVEGDGKPVAYLRPKDIERLAKPGVTGAINVQIANVPFIGCTVPVFAALPSSPLEGSV